jgi:hypothetical protein
MAAKYPKPAKEGTRWVGPPVDANGRVVKHPFGVGNAESLAALAGAFAFFTPALLYLYGGFRDGMLIDFMEGLGRDVPIYYRRFGRPLFARLEASDGSPDWNHALWAVHRDDYEPLAAFLLDSVLKDSVRRRVIRYAEQELEVADPVALDRRSVVDSLPTVAVQVWAVNASHGIAALRRPAGQPAALPALAFLPPAREVVVYAEALYKDRNPVNAAADYARRQQPKEQP